MSYDGSGNRVAQTVGLTTTSFALDVQGLPEVIYTSEDNAYLHLPGVIMTESATGTVRYLLSDGLGSVRQAVDEGATVVSYKEFDPYGNLIEDRNSEIVNRYAYTGEWWEEEVGLLYLRARWYAPGTGSFLSRDPVEGEPPYLYVRGNPVNQVDPSGLAPPAGNSCQLTRCQVDNISVWEHVHLGDYSDVPLDMQKVFPVQVIGQTSARKFVTITFTGPNVNESDCFIVQYVKGGMKINGTDSWDFWTRQPKWGSYRNMSPWHQNWSLDNKYLREDRPEEANYGTVGWGPNIAILYDAPGTTYGTNYRFTKYLADFRFITFIFDKASLPSLSTSYFQSLEAADLTTLKANMPPWEGAAEWEFIGIEFHFWQGFFEWHF